MQRRNIMKTIGGIGALSIFGSTASAGGDEHSDDEDEDDDNGGKPETTGRAFKRYKGDTNAIAAPTMGGLDTFAYYYAEGISTPDESWDPIAKGEAFQVDIMRRSEERIRENKEAARMFYEERFGLKFEEMDGLYGVDVAKHNGGAAIMAPIFLDPNVGYTVGALSGYDWPAYQDAYTDGDPQDGDEPESPTDPGKVRDGGWWVTVIDTMTDLDGSYWSNETLHAQPVEPTLSGTEGAMMTEDGLQGDPNSPGSMNLFFGDYNWYRGDAGEDIVINYKSTHPLDFNGNVPDVYVCDLWSPQLGGVGRVHGTAIPPQQASIEGGGTKFTLRNALTFPPELNSERDAVVFPEKYRFIPDWASEPLPHLDD